MFKSDEGGGINAEDTAELLFSDLILVDSYKFLVNDVDCCPPPDELVSFIVL